jgi:small-conductance mechanosensitive channel
MQDLRADARRAGSARRECVSSNPAPVILALVCAVVGIGAAIVVSSELGLSMTVVLAVTAAVALLGAFAAHRTVGSVLAGLMLLIVRPYAPGERLRFHLPCHGIVDAELVRIGLANTTLSTGAGLIVVPNSRLLRGTPQLQPVADVSSS